MADDHRDIVGLIGLQLAVLYGGVMQRRWSVNSMMLTFVVLPRLGRLVFVGLQDGLRQSVGHGEGFFDTFSGKSGTVL